MLVVAVIAAIAALLWLAIALPHLRLWWLLTAAIVLGYPLGHAFWHQKLGPLPLTLDRCLLVAAALVVVWRLWQRKLLPLRLQVVDWVLLAWLGWLSASAILSVPSDSTLLPESPIARLMFSFWVPVVVFYAARQMELSANSIKVMLIALTCLGVYLGFTAVAESTQQWWAVFPRYISDPELGLHFGRARGPALNSVSLGIYLSVCLWSAWLLLPQVTRFWQLALLSASALIAFAILLTLTRSVWLGMAASSFWVLFATLPQRLRWPVTASAGTMAIIALLAAKGAIVGMQREQSVSDAAHSVQQRAAFAYVSMQMVSDHPLWGVGFGRFYDKKLPYLQDRRQSFELESIRKLHHHNTFLSFLTETGSVGLCGFLFVMVGWANMAWKLTFSKTHDSAYLSLGQLLLATLLIYAASAAFHDLTLLPQDQLLLFFVAGWATAASHASLECRKTVCTTPPLGTLQPQYAVNV